MPLRSKSRTEKQPAHYAFEPEHAPAVDFEHFMPRPGFRPHSEKQPTHYVFEPPRGEDDLYKDDQLAPKDDWLAPMTDLISRRSLPSWSQEPSMRDEPAHHDDLAPSHWPPADIQPDEDVHRRELNCYTW